jgi:hypothetical protein
MAKPTGPCFDAEWRKRSRVRRGSLAEAMPFVLRHYLKKRPAVTVLTLIVEVDGRAKGMVLFSLPPRETAQRYGGETWELARLFLDDDVPANAESWAISQSVRFIKKEHPSVRVLVSYADPSAGHSGAIYRAANWAADGKTDDNRKTPRFDLVAVGADLFGRKEKKLGRAKHLARVGADSVERLPRVSKFRYAMRLQEAR